MNDPRRSSQSNDDRAIDRLVAGDITEAERRELLLRLENDPDGWRRCALAFLEDQAWRSALSGFATPRSLSDPIHPAPSKAKRTQSSAHRLAMAASVLVATFAAGLAAGGASAGRRATEIAPPSSVAREEPKAPAAEAEAQDSVREVGWINLVDRDSGESPRKVPILSGPGLDARWLKDQPSSVPEYVRALWERQGYQVEEHRRLVSVELDDGRLVSIPVDDVALEYVGQKTF